jgi:hypothetical protein
MMQLYVVKFPNPISNHISHPFRANQDVMILSVVTRHTARKTYDPINSTPPTHLFTSNTLFHLKLLQAATPRDRGRSVNPASTR